MRGPGAKARRAEKRSKPSRRSPARRSTSLARASPWEVRPDQPACRATRFQFSIRGPRRIADEFKALCKGEQRTYADMLRVLMDPYERGGERTSLARGPRRNGCRAVRRLPC